MRKLLFTVFTAFLMDGGALLKAQYTFNADVAPIVFAKCANCHNPNGINTDRPYTTYNQVVIDTPSIKDAIQDGHMPPWSPDTTYTKFLHQNERTLTATEKNTILQWIATGGAEGGGSPPVCPSYTSSNRLAGRADLVVGLGPVYSNSSDNNPNPYDCFVVPMGLTEDRWLRAAEVVPGNLQAVHHVVVTIDETGQQQSDLSGSCNNQLGQFGIAGWSSGAAPVVYPNTLPMKLGQKIKAGSSMCIQIHFAPGSGGLIDSTKIRLYFYDNTDTAGIRAVHDDVALQYWGLPIGPGPGLTTNPQPQTIPANSAVWITVNPGEPNTQAGSGGSIFIPDPQANNTDMSIIATNPHSHLVCKKIINYAYNGTDTIPLIRMNDWNYHWQGYYYHPKPIKVPYTHKLESKHYYVNDTTNDDLMSYGAQLGMSPNNAVSFGTATTDEMLFDDFVWINYQNGDENVDLAALAANDTIYSDGLSARPIEPVVTITTSLSVGYVASVETIENSSDKVSVKPNPANNIITITVKQSSEYIARLYNITGQSVLKSDIFKNSISIDINNISGGLYILEVLNVSSGEKSTEKIVIVH